MFNYTLTPEVLLLATQIFACTWIFTLNTWWQELLADLYINFIETWRPRPVFQRFFDYYYEIISCHKCLTFWTTLIITGNPIVALLFAWAASFTPHSK